METRETITLDGRTQQRLYVLNHVLAGELTAEQAGRVLRVSVRTVRRLIAAYRVAGAAGLVHGNRGRSPGHRTPDGLGGSSRSSARTFRCSRSTTARPAATVRSAPTSSAPGRRSVMPICASPPSPSHTGSLS